MLHVSPARLDPFAEILLPEAEAARLDAIERERRTAAHRVNGAQRIAHANIVHPNGADSEGMVSLMRATQMPDGTFRWETRVVPVSCLADSDDLLWATHLSMQRHRGARGRSAVAQVQALIADIECQTAMFRGMDHEEMAGVMLARLDAAGLPRPSYILCSGRGLHIVFLHEARKATDGFMRRWYAVMRGFHGPTHGKPMLTVRTSIGTRMADAEVIAHETKMAGIWRGTDLDRKVCDTARVLRLAGTWNPKSRSTARLVWPASWTDVERHRFEDLADAFLPWTRAQLQALRDERHAEWSLREANRQARGVTGDDETETPARRRCKGSYWHEIAEALDAVRVWWGGSPPEGMRDLWGFLSACALAQHEGGTAASWAARLHGPAGLPEDEMREALGALDASLRRHEAGEVSVRDGVERTTVYSYSKGRMIDLLGLTPEMVAEIPGAEALLEGGGVRKDERQRSAERRQVAGAEARPLTVEARLADGYEALAMRDAGMSPTEIVAAFGGRRARTSLYRAMREAEAAGPRPVVETVSEAVEEGSVPVVHDSTDTIVAEPEPEATPLAAPLSTASSDPVPAIAIAPDRPLASTEPPAAPYSPSPDPAGIDIGPCVTPLLTALPDPRRGPVATVNGIIRNALTAPIGQGASYSPSASRAGDHSSHLAEPPSRVSPGHGPGGPDDLELPAFLADLTGVRWTSQLPVAP
ncbi:hypothetical protein [Methylobacterium sp. J-067]|uniref:hypothetical protein n=1 Tax=Methylobacterium sp. J-067 TaxID=2836648 RepID=UPI001FB9DE6F|nr:hypothetical protein [Methylobacterium sp. J-067]MCJ2023242.1 hypothetical protein [Methylobacterium sp. J-067]